MAEPRSHHDRIIYLDHAASSFPKAPGVAEAVASALVTSGGNPGRGAHALALEAARLVHAARRDLAELLGVPDARDLSFQAGCTAGLNLALLGLIRPGDRVVVSSMEHNSVVRPLHALSDAGVEVVVVDADDAGAVDPDAVEAIVRQAPTRAVVVQHASNVSGTIQPIGDLADIAHSAGARLIVDGAQAGGHLDVDLSTLGADAWACSGHKGLLGPQGTGVLYLAPDLDLPPLVRGGTGSVSELPAMPIERPDRYEAGTPNVPGIAGLGAAARFLKANGEELRAEEQRLIRLLHEGLLGLGFRVLGPEPGIPRVPLISAVHPALDADRIAFELDRGYGIAVRAGLHCAPWAHRTLGTLETGAVRFGVGYGVDQEQIAETLRALETIVAGVPS
ncbi:MAG: aminotransferase class V-fold PLP-dependent enzyme [Coriobacteriales bacterium]|nr:aminotransferase class V-fold PLP-dependent enzyme [Coriobacteriales bacterium]